MAPILKESELVGTPIETSALSSTNGAAEAQPKVQPVALEVTVTVNGARAIPGSDKREPFSEVTKTVLVLGTGAVIRLSSPVSPGQLLFLTNERTKKEVVCQVVKSKNYRNVSGYVELEFTESVVGFWGMRFPGDRIGSGGSQLTPAPPALGSTPAAPRPAASQPPVKRAEAPALRVEPPAPAVVSSPPVAQTQPAAPVAKQVAPQPKIEARPVRQETKQATPQWEVPAQAPTLEEFLAPQVAPVSKAPEPDKAAQVIPVAPLEPEVPPNSAYSSTTARPPSVSIPAAAFDPEIAALEPFFKNEPSAPTVVPPSRVSAPAPPVPSVQNARTAPPAVLEEAPKPATPQIAKASEVQDPETEALRQQAARLQEQLSSLLFTDVPVPAPAADSNVSAEKPAPASSHQVQAQPVPEKSASSHVPFSEKEIDLAELLELTPLPMTAAPEAAAPISVEELSALRSALSALPAEESAEPDSLVQNVRSSPGIEVNHPVPAKPPRPVKIDDLREPVAAAPVAAESAPRPEPVPVAPPVKAAEKIAEAPKQSPAPKIPPKPVKTSLDDTALDIPIWLEPLARNTTAPTSTQELVEREKAKRISQPPRPAEVPKPAVSSSKPKKVPSWAAPLPKGASAPAASKELAPKKEASKAIDVDALFEDKPTSPAPSDAHRHEAPIAPAAPAPEPRHEVPLPPAVPTRVEQQEEDIPQRSPAFGAELHVSESEYQGPSESEGSRKGLLIAVLAAVLVVLAGGAWWYVRQKPPALPVASAALPAAAAPVNPAPGTALTNSSVPVNPVVPPRTEASPSRVAAQPPASSASRSAHVVSNPPSNNVAASAPEPALVKKPELSQARMATPTITQRRPAQNLNAADPGLSLGDSQPESGSGALGSGLAVSNAQPAAPTAPSAPVTIGGDVKTAKLISSVAPVYPALAKSQHISGDVKVDALIDERGRVTSTKVISGPTLLQQAAMEALKLWKYQPATLDGKPVPMHLTVTLQFRLQ